MNIKKVLILLAVVFLAYKFLYRAPEEDYGQYSGPEQRAPQLTGSEIIGHMRIYLSTQNYSAGHGFVLDFKSQQYVVSASHIVNDLKSVDSVDVVLDSEALVSDAKPALGPSYSTCNMEDARRDITFYELKSKKIGGDLVLANVPPKSGQRVWLMCTERANGKKKVLIPALVTASSNRALKYKFHSPMQFQGSSGCPVVDSELRLVGVNVCGHAEAGVAVPIPTIMDSLKSL